MSAYNDMEELIRLGAYRPGSDKQVDEAIELQPALEGFLTQAKSEQTDRSAGFALLEEILRARPAEEGVAQEGE